MNTKLLFFVVVFAALSVFVVYAGGLFDTDGGFNIWEKGICGDDSGNHTDFCLGFTPKDQRLLEWYPNETLNACVSAVVNCTAYNSTCVDGACVLK